MSAVVIRVQLVLPDGSTPPGNVLPFRPHPQEIQFSQWDDVEVHFDFYTQDRNPCPIPEGAAIQIVGRANSFDQDPPLFSALATITNIDGGEDCAYVPIDSSTTGAIGATGSVAAASEYTYDVVYVAPSGKRFHVAPLSPLAVSAASARPGTPVVPGASQPALGLGPQGVAGPSLLAPFASLPLASGYANGSPVWDSTTHLVAVSDGTDWWEAGVNVGPGS